MNLRLDRDLIPAGSKVYRELQDFIGVCEPGQVFEESWQAAIYGILSGFPVCCVKFYITEWMPFFTRQGQDAVYEKWPQSDGGFFVGRIRCPQCLALGPVLGEA